MKTIKLFFIILFFGAASHVSGQTDSALNYLAVLGQQTVALETEEEREEARVEFHELLEDYLTQHDPMTVDVSAVKNVVTAMAPDNTFRFFTYAFPQRGGTYKFYGFLAIREKKSVKFMALDDLSDEIQGPEYAWLKPEKWYGALYYEVIKTGKRKKPTYTLLGYRPSLAGTQSKVVDVLELGRKIRFGKEVFETPILMDRKYKQRPYRLILEYSSQFSATVRWQEKEGWIVMDHLSPPDASLRGHFRMYGPDFTYDALYWEDEKWHLKSGVTVKSDVKPVSNPDIKPKAPANIKRNTDGN